jgi:hypothetical protein
MMRWLLATSALLWMTAITLAVLGSRESPRPLSPEQIVTPVVSSQHES